MSHIYLDHAATTPILPEVREAMLPWLGDEYGNPSSAYATGRKARVAIDGAREALSETFGCLFGEVLFTSGGTEAANLAVIGTALGLDPQIRPRILLGPTEHHCVLHTAAMLTRLGFQPEFLRVGPDCRLDLDDLEARMGPDVGLVSVMRANNETGAINDIAKMASIAKKHGALVHTDAVQSFLTIPEKVDELGVDLYSVSAHKIHGPKGVGALYVRAGTPLKPMLYGGGQEREMRAGTENVAAIVGFGEAVRRVREMSTDQERQARDAFVKALDESLNPPIWTLDATTPKLPGHAHGRFPGVDAVMMLIRLDRVGIEASSGSACSAGAIEPSHVLLACGLTKEEASQGLRFTFGRESTVEEATEAARIVAENAAKLMPARR